jgi:hypothetical protein
MVDRRARGGILHGIKMIDASDSTLKRNIRSMSRYGLDDLMKLKPVEYYYKSDKTNKLELGFLAQDLINIIPEAVFGEKGNMGISYGSLIPVLTNAIKELKAENEELKTKLYELEQLKTEIEKIKIELKK